MIWRVRDNSTFQNLRNVHGDKSKVWYGDYGNGDTHGYDSGNGAGRGYGYGNSRGNSFDESPFDGGRNVRSRYAWSLLPEWRNGIEL